MVISPVAPSMLSRPTTALTGTSGSAPSTPLSPAASAGQGLSNVSSGGDLNSLISGLLDLLSRLEGSSSKDVSSVAKDAATQASPQASVPAAGQGLSAGQGNAAQAKPPAGGENAKKEGGGGLLGGLFNIAKDIILAPVNIVVGLAKTVFGLFTGGGNDGAAAQQGAAQGGAQGGAAAQKDVSVGSGRTLSLSA